MPFDSRATERGNQASRIFLRCYWLMHDRLLITMMTVTALDSVLVGMAAHDVAVGVLLMLATVLAFHRHIIYTLAVAIVCCPVSLVAQCRLSPWTAVALLAVDAAGAHLNRANKRLSSEATFASDAESISLESGYNQPPVAVHSTSPRMLF